MPSPRKPAITHAALVAVASRWLRRQRCGVVLTEHDGGTLEKPDAIGWRGWWSIQVECKVSRADFFADRKKPGRRFDGTTGEYRQAAERWYLVPDGLIVESDLPDGWGLLTWTGRRVRVRRHASRPEKTEHVWRAEVTRLFCELRRYQAQGIRYQTVAELMAPSTPSVPAQESPR